MGQFFYKVSTIHKKISLCKFLIVFGYAAANFHVPAHPNFCDLPTANSQPSWLVYSIPCNAAFQKVLFMDLRGLTSLNGSGYEGDHSGGLRIISITAIILHSTSASSISAVSECNHQGKDQTRIFRVNSQAPEPMSHCGGCLTVCTAIQPVQEPHVFTFTTKVSTHTE